MASSTKMWTLFVLALLSANFSTGEDLDPDRLSILYSSSSQLEYKTAGADDQNGGESEEVSVVGQGNLNSDNDAMSVMEQRILEAMEQPSTRKKASCVGCPTDIDVGIPANREILLGYLKAPLAAINAESPFTYGPANIIAATKQVESGIRYVITFETIRSSCPMLDGDSSGEECAQTQSVSHLCVVDILAKLDGLQEVMSVNCSEARQVSSPSESNEDSSQGSFSEAADVPERDTIQINEEEIDGALNSSSEDDLRRLQYSHVRDRRSINLGALKDVDNSEHDLISQFAELAVKTLDEVDPDNMKQIVLEITEAKKQIVNGVMYHLVLRVGTSTCQEDGVGAANTNCVENQLYPERVCRVQIHRSWADESPLNAKVVKSECADLWPQESMETPSAERTRRSSQDNWPSTEGWKQYDLQHGSQQDCFDKVMISFQDLLDVKDVTKVATVRDAHTRVNKETNQPEMVVTIVLMDPMKLKMMGKVKKPMVVSSRVICSQRLKRSPGVPGGLSDIAVNDPQVVEISNFALSEIQKSVNSPYQHTLVRVVEAKRQVVAGTLYHLKLEVAPTTCLKSDQSSQTCTSSTSEQRLVCTLKVWDQPWTNLREVQDISCESSRSKREEHPVLGGLQPVESDSPYVKELASFAVTEIDKGLNSPYQQKVLRVVEAKSQVVAGTLMHLKLELVTTNCLKSEKVGSENCVHDPDQASTMCSVKVWDRPWLKQREIQDVQCGRSRSKREASGFENSKFSHVDVNDPYILETARYVCDELDKSINSPYRHKIVHIVSAEVQHTDATKVRLALDVGYSTCKKSSKSNDCDLLTGTDPKLCHIELKHVVHLHERHITSLDCSGSHHNNLRPHNNHLIGEDDVDTHAALFREFMQRWNKTYPSDAELHKRFNIFRANLKEIDRLQKGEQGTAIYGHTIFADLTPKEFREKYMGLRHDLRQENAIPMQMANIPKIKLPPSFDWRDHNAVTPVKNQGACGSCWAFAVTGNIEGQNAIKHGKLISLSEQELVDCDTLDDGCKGGLPENAYHALEQLGGIETESDYPYEAEDEQCHFVKSEAKVQVKSSVNITTNEENMAKWLVKNGPIAIGINANAMQFYVGGVSHPFKFLCSPGSLDHGVLIVGYGVHTTSIRHKVLPYWLIKNSWGTFWGEKGYYRVYRGDGTCGVNQMASSAVIE